jgi:hypothetical protein
MRNCSTSSGNLVLPRRARQAVAVPDEPAPAEDRELALV